MHLKMIQLMRAADDIAFLRYHLCSSLAAIYIQCICARVLHLRIGHGRSDFCSFHTPWLKSKEEQFDMILTYVHAR